MRRPFLEWLTIASAGALLTTLGAFGGSFAPGWPMNPLAAGRDRSDNIFAWVQVDRGRLRVFSDVDYELPGGPRPWVIDPSGFHWPPVATHRELDLPGLACRYCRFAGGDGEPIWSVDASLLYPSLAWLILLAWLISRRGREPAQPRTPEAPAP